MFGFVLHALLIAFANPVAISSDLVQELCQRDQALLDAIAPGDVKVWEAALAADAVYVDENGMVMTRADFIRQFTPLPAGASGTLVISAYSAQQSGDAVTVVHTDDEDELYHGQHLKAQYLMNRNLATSGRYVEASINSCHGCSERTGSDHFVGFGNGCVCWPLFCRS